MSIVPFLLFAAVLAQDARPPATLPQATATVPATFYARNMTRVESWRYFEPRAGGGDPDYTFVANRLHVGVRHTATRWDFAAAGQYVQFGNLSERAVGPGPLGTGGAYFDASGDTASRQLYLKYLNVSFQGLAQGLTVQAGRFAYTSGAESSSGNATIEATKRLRVDSRLIGEFEWSIYQRSFDGVRGDWRRGAYQQAFVYRYGDSHPNLRDAFAQIMLRPLPALGIRADIYRLDLTNRADRWYFGSGVTQRRGTGFGYGCVCRAARRRWVQLSRPAPTTPSIRTGP